MTKFQAAAQGTRPVKWSAETVLFHTQKNRQFKNVFFAFFDAFLFAMVDLVV